LEDAIFFGCFSTQHQITGITLIMSAAYIQAASILEHHAHYRDNDQAVIGKLSIQLSLLLSSSLIAKVSLYTKPNLHKPSL